MNEIQFSKKQLSQIKKMGIETIYLFGSRVKGITTPLSDFDFGIVFKNPEKYKDKTMMAYLKLYNIFTDILPKKYLKKRFEMKAHELDIVFLQFAPINLQFEAISKGKVIYEKSTKKRFAYQEYVMKRCADLQYFYNLRYQAILERI